MKPTTILSDVTAHRRRRRAHRDSNRCWFCSAKPRASASAADKLEIVRARTVARCAGTCARHVASIIHVAALNHGRCYHRSAPAFRLAALCKLHDDDGLSSNSLESLAEAYQTSQLCRPCLHVHVARQHFLTERLTTSTASPTRDTGAYLFAVRVLFQCVIITTAAAAAARH